MKILVISQYFWPENFKINDVVVDLCQKGHDVTVLTSHPNYPKKSLFKDYYAQKKDFKKLDQANIIRIPVISRGKSRFRLSLNYISFFLSASIFGAIKLKNKKFDKIFVFQTSPVTVIIPALIISKQKKIPIVMWVLDLWPETLISMKVISNKHLINFFEYLMKLVYKRCKLILCQSKKITNLINTKNNFNKAKYFPSWAEEIFYKEGNKKIDNFSIDKSRFNIFFTGNVGIAQDFKTVLGAFEILKNEKINVCLNVVGDGSKIKWLKEEIQLKNIDNVTIHGRYDLEYIPYIYSLADALLLSLADTILFSSTIPAKLQTYLLSKKPIIGMVAGEAKNIIHDAKCGFSSCPGDKEELAYNIKKIVSLELYDRNIMGNNGLLYSNKNFMRSQLLNDLNKLLEAVK